ncbi:MAG TPA: S41 family peptidase [Acidobacteriaceae bacterium]
MSKSFRRAIFSLSVVLALVVLLGGFVPTHVRAGGQDDGAYKQMGVFEEVLHKIQDDYVVDPSIPAVTSGALHGLLESLDSDSSYLTPEEYRAYKAHQNDGTAQIGLNVSKRMGYATVVSVMPNSPAEKQQISDGDLLESIDGQSTHEMSLAMIRLLLEGKPGSPLTISVVRPRKAEPDLLKFTRSSIVPPALAEQQYDSASILYLKPTVLTRERVAEIEARLHAMGKNNNKKVLLDLRDVTVGDEAQGVRLANAFLQSGKIASVEGQKYPAQTFTADPAKFITAAPLAVLVNHGTSGAAEIVAAAILDNKRGDLVGDRTFGEGVVQKTFDLPDGAALLLSVAKFESPSGKRIQDDAVTPNVTVSPSIDQYLAEQDGTAANPGASNKPQTDDQLTKALDLLKAKQA